MDFTLHSSRTIFLRKHHKIIFKLLILSPPGKVKGVPKISNPAELDKSLQTDYFLAKKTINLFEPALSAETIPASVDDFWEIIRFQRLSLKFRPYPDVCFSLLLGNFLSIFCGVSGEPFFFHCGSLSRQKQMKASKL